MNTDFASEFRKIFSNGCAPLTDWSQPRYFDSQNNDCYGSEAALMASLTSEAYNKFGIAVEYFVKEHDTKFDPLLGEDQLENISRRFSLQVYAENIPNLQKQYQLQGMIYTEIITVQCTIQHFNEASRYDWKTENPIAYDPILPKIGDLMYFKYSDLYYEVLNVKEFAEGTNFLSTPITYTFSLRVWRNSHENVDEMNVNDDNMEHLRSYVELGETFNVEHDMGEHTGAHELNPAAANVEEHPEYNPSPTSQVAASGDILSINDTTDWKTLRKSNDADAMDVLHNPNKIFEPFDALQSELDNIDNEYKDAMVVMGNRADEIVEEVQGLNDKVSEIEHTGQEHVTELKNKANQVDRDIFDLGMDTDVVEYSPKKK
jgi:hypothetical protein